MSFILPLTERRVLHRRAYAGQMRGGREVCGALLTDTARRLRLVFMRNEAKGPATFEVDLEAFRDLARSAQPRRSRVIGMFHSHPGGYAVPGPSDMRDAFHRGMALIYDVVGGEAKLYRRYLRGRRVIAREIALVVEPGALRDRRPRGGSRGGRGNPEGGA